MEYVQETKRERNFLRAQQRMKRHHNAQYERALGVLVKSDNESFLTACFTAWFNVNELEKRERAKAEIEAEKERLYKHHNEQYERALITWAESTERTLKECVLQQWA